MKKSTKRLLVTALICALIGIAFEIAAFCCGASVKDFQAALTEEQYGSILPGYDHSGSIAGTALAIPGRITQSVRQFVGSIAPSGSGKMFEDTYSEVKALELDLGVAACTLIPWKEKTVKVVGEDLPGGFGCKQSGDKLSIDCGDHRWNLFGVSAQKSILTIYVPEQLELDKMDIDSGVGEFRIQEGFIRCKKLKMDCGVGNSEIRVDASEKVEIEGGVGEINLILTGQETDYDYDVECGIGELVINGKHYSGLGTDHKVNHHSDKEISVECGIGAVTISFES